MRLISLGDLNKKLIYPLIGAICKLIANFVLDFGDEYFDFALDNHPFIIAINTSFGMSLTIIPYLYIWKYSRIAEKESLNNNKYLDQFFKKRDPIVKKKKYLILFLCSFLDFTQKILTFLFSFKLKTNLWMFNIIIINVFTSMITQNKLYRHQYFSSGIMILFGILLNVVNLKGMETGNIPILILNILIEIIYSLCIVLAKYGMDDLFCSPYEITFYEGIFALILNIIFLIISTNIPIPSEKVWFFFKFLKVSEYDKEYYLDNFYTYINQINLIEVFLFILHMLARASFNLFSHITIKYFTSSHVILILILGEIFISFIEKNTGDILMTLGISIVEFFMVLVFCEIIELNFCDLEKNTRKNIQERAKLSIYDEEEEGGESKIVIEGLELNSEENSTIND